LSAIIVSLIGPFLEYASMMSLIQRLRRWLRPASLSRSERDRAARLGIYFIEAEGYDRQERGMFSRIVGVYLNSDEANDRMQSPPRHPSWEDVEYKRWGPRPLSSLLETYALSVDEAKLLLKRAAQGDPHELLPEPLSAAERRQAEDIKVYLIWYEDKFHYGIGRDSYATSVCLSREEAEAAYQRDGRQPAPPGGDGYEIVGPSPLQNQPAEVVRQVLRRRQAGQPGPVPIPSKYW